jgi:hypothetical protein
MAMATEQIAFELERFRWAAPDRLELTGRWFGVRGLRFVRPELFVDVDGAPRRVVAVLDHKPWAPHEGEDWIAAFTWRAASGEVGAAELSVGPGIRVELPPPGGDAPPRRALARRQAAAPPRERKPADAKPAARTRARPREPGPASELLRLNQALTGAREERDEAQREREAERARVAELAAELDSARAEHARAAAELEGERAAAMRERDEAKLAETAARRALETAEAERDEARRERAAARGARDEAVEAQKAVRESAAAQVAAAASASAAAEPAPRAQRVRDEPARHEPLARPAAPLPPSTPRLLHDPAGRSGLALWGPRLVAVALVLGLLVALLLILGAL